MWMDISEIKRRNKVSEISREQMASFSPLFVRDMGWVYLICNLRLLMALLACYWRLLGNEWRGFFAMYLSHVYFPQRKALE